MQSKAILLLFMMIGFSICLFSNVSANALDTMETNLGMSIADIIMIVISAGCIIFVAVDARIALMIALLLYTGVFVLFTLATEEGYGNFNPYYSGVAMMLCFVVICLSLLISYKRGNTPYGAA